MDGNASDIAGFQHDFTAVDADAHTDAERRGRLDNCGRAPNRQGGPGEDGHEAIAGVLDLPAVKSRDLSADRVVVAIE